MPVDKEGMRAQCEREGIHWARSTIGAWSDGEVNQFVRQWVDEYETRDRAAIESKQLRLAERSVDAAESSSEAAKQSATTSGTSARAAVFSAFVSLLALVVAVAAYMKQP